LPVLEGLMCQRSVVIKVDYIVCDWQSPGLI